MLEYALIVLAIGAVGGLVMDTRVLRGQFAPWALSVLHALLGATGLVLLILLMLQGSPPQRVLVGFGLLLTMHRPLGLGFDLRTSVVLIPVAQALVALPLVVRTLLPVLRGLDPRQREAAALLGASPLRVLGTIDLRVLGRPLGLALGFSFAASLGEFGASSFLVRPGAQTMPVLLGPSSMAAK